MDFASKWLNPPLWLIERGKGLVDNPTLCELLNRYVAPLVRVNFGINYWVTCSCCIYFVLVDLELVLSRSTLELFLCTRSLAGYSRTHWWIFDSNRLFSFISVFESRFSSFWLLEVPSQYWKFRPIGISYIGSKVPTGLTCAKNFSSFIGLPIHPPPSQHQDPFNYRGRSAMEKQSSWM